MKKQWLNFLVNPFEWIAGFQALGCFHCYQLSFRMALSWFIALWAGPESSLVVLCC